MRRTWTGWRNASTPYPNFVVDVASRVRYLMAGDREKARQFVLQYQDRILYATDFTLGAGGDAQAAESLQATHDREWNFFATGDMVTSRDRQVQGLALPEPVLRKIFRENAVRTLPGSWGEAASGPQRQFPEKTLDGDAKQVQY